MTATTGRPTQVLNRRDQRQDETLHEAAQTQNGYGLSKEWIDCFNRQTAGSGRLGPVLSTLAGQDTSRLVIIEVKRELVGFVTAYGADLGACIHARGDEVAEFRVGPE